MISSSNGKNSSSLHLTRRGRGRCFLLICFVGAAVLYLSGVTHLLSEPPTIGPYVSPPTEEGAPLLTTLVSDDVVVLGAQVSSRSKAGSTKVASSWSKRWSIVTRQDHVAALWPVKGCPQQSASMVAVSNVWSRAAAGSHFRQVLSKTCGGSCRYARGEESQNPSAPWFCTDDEKKRNKFVAPAAQILHDFSGIPFVSGGVGNNGDAQSRCGDDGSDTMGATINPEVALQAASAVEPLPTVLHVVFCAMGERFQGPGGQSYVVESIKQWRLFHPIGTSVIHLVMDRAVAQSDPLIGGLIQHEKQLWKWGGVAADRSSYKEGGDGGRMVVVSPNFIIHYTDALLKASTEWRRYHKYFYVQGYMHPGGTRSTGNKQFNQLVSERFFAVEALMRTQNLTNILHLENDITVYDSFVPMVHATMRCGYDMATTVIHIKGVIPSVLYVRSADALARFTAYLTEFLRCGPAFGKAIQKGYANDMTYLKNFYQLFGSRALGIFPTWKHKHGELCINTALDTLRTAAASSSVVTNKDSVAAGESEGGLGVGNGLGPLFEFYGLLMDRIRDQANMLVTGGDQGLSSPSQEQHLPSAVSAPNGVLLDGASFGQWYSSVAVTDPSYLFFKGSVDLNREKGRKVVPPEHVRNSVADKRFLDATPPQVMVWEPYMSSTKLMVPSWGGYRISTLHVHQKNLNLFGSLHPRLTAGWDNANTTTGAHHD